MRSSFKKGERVWVYYNTSAQNDRERWVSARVVEAAPHGLKCRRLNKRPPMTAAHEKFRIAPKGKLASELLDKTLEDELY